MTPITLPYPFDTRRETRLLLKLGLALLAVMVAGGLFMLVARHDIAGAAGTLLIDAMLIAFGRVLLRVQPGAEGRITRDAVEVHAGKVWGIALPGPVGTFALRDFEAVQVERMLVSGDHSTALHPIERVTLAGRHGTPDVPVLVTAVAGGDAPGEALAAALGLPCQVVRAPRQLRWPRMRRG
jgi:hypothetical protein